MLKINGEQTAFDGTVMQYLEQNGYQIARIVVELNGKILPKPDYAATPLHDGDTVEIVRFVGGG